MSKGSTGRPIGDLIQILSASGGLDIDASAFSVEELKMLASYAASRSATLNLRNLASLQTSDLIVIASYGDSNIVFVDP